MLNPKLREIYSENVIPALEVISKSFEERNVTAYVVDKREYKNIIAPVAIVFDKPEFNEEAYTIVDDASQSYMKLLEPEDEEYFYGIMTIGNKHIWDEIDKEKVLLWVK